MLRRLFNVLVQIFASYVTYLVSLASANDAVIDGEVDEDDEEVDVDDGEVEAVVDGNDLSGADQPCYQEVTN